MTVALTHTPLIDAIEAVLTGVATAAAATAAGLDEYTLQDAVDLYRLAGRDAVLQSRSDHWIHIRIRFTGDAENAAATLLAPWLAQAHTAGRVRRWNYLRKWPYWRIRVQPSFPAGVDDLRSAVGRHLDNLAAQGHITRWDYGIYEPEAYVFGGPAGIDIAHDLFHADSTGVLTYLAAVQQASGGTGLGRRELAVLLCSSLFRSAGLEWHEQADVWDRVAALRPLPADHTNVSSGLTGQLFTLLTIDTRPDGALLGPSGPLHAARTWAAGLQATGVRLADAAHQANLSRGLREILAHHTIFMWNRLGVPDRAQPILAHAARNTIMG